MMRHEKRLEVLTDRPVRWLDPKSEWEVRFAEWRRNPTIVLQCPVCDALRGLHRIDCELR